jgi:hypothetical protein
MRNILVPVGGHPEQAEETMLDVIFVLSTAIAFGIAILYVRGCERLR